MQQQTINDLAVGLSEILSEGNLFMEESMKKHTSFRIGGPARFYCIAETFEEVQEVVELCKKENVSYFVLGNGTNILVKDEGYDGVVIRLLGEMNLISIEDEINQGTAIFTAGAGVALTQLSMKAMNKGFTGLEFAHGIPGSVGGAVYMNAGAYGGDISQCLVSAMVLDKAGNIKEVSREELQLSYRHSSLMESGDIVLAAKFRLKVYPRIMIRTYMESFKKARQAKQPLEYPSAGSTFKRPIGAFAGKLIQDAGLKGYSVGGCQVSEKHAGFVINTGNATSDDFIKLTNDVIAKVKENSGITLELEVRILE